jgi:hypothetical protein
MPDDRTPHGGEIMHRPPDRAQIPEPEPGRPADEPVRGQPRATDKSEDKSASGGGKTDFVQTPD